MRHEDIRRRGFKDRTRLADARSQLASRVSPHGRAEEMPLEHADGRVTAVAIRAETDVPHYDRAAMDGWAVIAADTVGAADRSPNYLDVSDVVSGGAAVPVHTGSALPQGADAVIMKEETQRHDEILEVYRAVAVGENVGKTGEDVREGTQCINEGVRLRPSELGVAKSIGRRSISVAERPRVAVLPTGEELVQSDPAPGEIIETNGLTVSRLVSRWGGTASYRDIVTDDPDVLQEAIDNERDHDLIVTTGGSSVGDRDLLPQVVDQLGEVFVHGVALKPGHPVALGEIDETPILMLPGYPVACLVNAVQFLRPAIGWSLGTTPVDPPSITATLERKLRSEPGTRTFARVKLDVGETVVATPTRASGAGVLSSVTEADGWVAVPESRDGYAAGATVEVEQWEWCP